MHRAGLSTQRRIPRRAVEQDRGGADDARAGSCSRRSWRRSTPGSSTTGPTRTRRTSSISYYTKGAVIGFLLDAKIRKATGGAKSLDDVMRAAYQKYLGRAGLHAGGVPAVAEQVAGADLSPFWDSVRSTAPRSSTTPRRSRRFGLRFRAGRRVRAGAPGSALTTRNDAGRLVVSQVRRDTPALRGRPQRGRRDPRHRRLPRARRPAGRAAGPVQARRQGARCSSRGATSCMTARDDTRRRAAAAVAARGRPRRTETHAAAAARPLAQAAGMNVRPAVRRPGPQRELRGRQGAVPVAADGDPLRPPGHARRSRHRRPRPTPVRCARRSTRSRSRRARDPYDGTLRGSLLPRRAADRARRAARTSPAACTPRAAATTST